MSHGAGRDILPPLGNKCHQLLTGGLGVIEEQHSVRSLAALYT